MTFTRSGPFVVIDQGAAGKIHLPYAGTSIVPIPGLIGRCMLVAPGVQAEVQGNAEDIARDWTGGDITDPPQLVLGD